MPSNKTGATYVGASRVLLRAANGFKMYVDSRDVSIAPHLILDGLWEEHVERALRDTLRPGMHVIEVGANVGYFTLVFARGVGSRGSVTSFEPDPALARFVRDNIDINGLHRIARVQERAVSDAIGTATFYARDRHLGGGSLIAQVDQVPWNPTDTRTQLSVPTTTLDAQIAAAGVEPDFVKIDAEGAESAVLRGAQRLLSGSRPLKLLLEFIPQFVRDSGDDPAQFLARLSACGFRIKLIEERRKRIVAVTPAALLDRDYSELLFERS